MGKTVNSLKDLGAAMGVKTKTQERTARTLKCRNCGANMEHIAGTNVFVCNGTKTFQNAEGKEITKACGNTFLSKI